MAAPTPIWRPTEPEEAIPINQYRRHINSRFGKNLQNSHELHQWSVSQPQDFWVDLWSSVDLIPALPPGVEQAYDPEIPMNKIPRFFEGVNINYAENVLTQPNVSPDAPALIGLREGQGLDGEVWPWSELREKVRQIRSGLVRSGIKEGDRVAALISTSNWSIAIFLATASLGAIFTSIASDLGLDGCLSRLQQTKPAFVFADSHVTYKGKQRCNLEKIQSLAAGMDNASQPLVVLIPLLESPGHPYLELNGFLSRSRTEDRLAFKRVPFSAPLYILYSSGTSGPPKCLVHQHGVILQHRKISRLHNSLRPGEVVFQFSSPSWVLWNIMIGHMSAGTTLVVYDGSPTFPTPAHLLKVAARHNVAYWGCSPGYLQALEASGAKASDHDLSHLRMVQTGGSHLAASQYHWFYDTFPSKVHLTSVTGGTDIVTSWIGTDPAGPVYPGELQIPILGHDIDVADPSTGESMSHLGTAGEMVCRKPFPSMPIFFWGDDGSTYQASYFDKFDFPCWAQHDWAVSNPLTGGYQILGRSDGVLNPQGIRFGSSEIYSIVEARPFSDAIQTSLCIGRKRRGIDSDESVFLFVIMREGYQFDATLDRALREAIRGGLSARHVPRFVFPVKEIPMTVNGKKVETLVKQTMCTGEIPTRISSTLTNAHCLEDFKRFYHVGDAHIRPRL